MLSLSLLHTHFYGLIQLFADTSEAPDTPEEALSSVTPPPENPQSNSLQEAAAVAPIGSAASTESQS